MLSQCSNAYWVVAAVGVDDGESVVQLFSTGGEWQNHNPGGVSGKTRVG